MTGDQVQDPHLGLPAQLLADLASTDFHAGHPQLHHLATGCPCTSEATVGAFAVRLVTGQAQWSTTTTGDAISVVMAPPRALIPPSVAASLDGRPALALLAVKGDVRSEPCDCADGEPHDHQVIDIVGASLGGHPDIDAQDCVDLLVDALEHLITDHRTRGGDR